MAVWEWISASAGAMAEGQPPLWPWALRPSLAALDDSILADEIRLGALAACAAMVLLVLAWRIRRFRLAAIIAATALAVFGAAPHLDLLLVPAVPTVYFHSPTGFSADAIARGEGLFARHCQSCHGLDGHGDGPDAPRQKVPPADLTADHLWDHPDGELYWWIGHGITGPDGATTMPGFADRLGSAEVWDLIDFVHANAAGAAMARGSQPPRPLPAPDFAATCGDGRRISLSQLRHRAVHVVGTADAATAPDLPAIALAPGQVPASGAACVADTPAAGQAFAVIAGLAPEDWTDGQFLIGPEGQLLAHWPMEAAPPAASLSGLVDTLRAICLSPPGDERRHRHGHRH